MNSPGLSPGTRVLILAAFYLVGGLVGKQASFMGGEAVLVWPPAGIALGAILLFGMKFWPGVALGSVMFSLLSGHSIGYFTLGTAIGNTIGALTCAYLLQRFVHFKNNLTRVRDVAGLVGFACILGTTLNAAFNVVSLCLEGILEWDEMFNHLVQWWVPNAMAVLVVAPLILTWGTKSDVRWSRSLIVEAAICGAGLFIGTNFSFYSWVIYGIANYPWAYIPYPFLVWAALRFGQQGATAGTVLVSSLAIHSLLQGRGPFVAPTEVESLMLIGTYIGVLSISNMLLAAVACERRRTEADLVISEQRFRAVVEDQTELIWRFKEDGLLTFVNSAYCRFHGKPVEELIGTSYLSYLPEEDREIPLSYFAELTPDNPVVTFDDKVISASGNYVWLQCTTRRLFDDKGNPLEYQSVGQDITMRKQKEDEIRRGEERLRVILESMVDGLVVVDASGSVTSFNPAAERVFGIPAQQVIGKPIKSLFVPGDQELYEEYFSRRLKKGRTEIIEVSASRPDGTTAPIDLAISEVMLGGAPMLVVVVRDISERKNIEAQFRQAQKMEAVGRLAGGIAHDFNNFMQAIIGYANLLLRRAKPDDPNRETISQIEKSAERAATMTSQLLTFSRKQVLKPKIISLNAIVADVHRLLQRLIGEDIELDCPNNEALGCIKADPGQIQQVLMNLCVNARDAMPQGGRLELRSCNVDLTGPLNGAAQGFNPGPYVKLAVSDTGMGMTPDVKAHLFEPFFTTKEVGKGTGLGLSIVYGIVKQSGGEILVKSEINKGTTFEIYLPRLDGVVEEEAEALVEGPAVQGEETVMLVEDGEIVRAMLAEVLKEEGYRVLEAENGNDALTLAEDFEDDIDLLVTDLIMPQISGQELARTLKDQRPDIKVLFISGYTDDEALRHGQLGEGAYYLQKPFRPEILLTKARMILDQTAAAVEE